MLLCDDTGGARKISLHDGASSRRQFGVSVYMISIDLVAYEYAGTGAEWAVERMTTDTQTCGEADRETEIAVNIASRHTARGRQALTN